MSFYSLAIAIQTAVAAWLLLGQPFYGRLKYETLKYRAPRDPRARTRSYLATILTEWGLVALACLGLYLDKTPTGSIGLKPPVGVAASVTWWLTAAAVAGAIAITIQMLRRADLRAAYREGMGHISHLLPDTGGERALFAAVAATAGFCEEVLFRGFLPLYFVTVLPTLPFWAALLLAAVSFGVGHWYQGRRGIIQTGLLGLALAAFYFATGSLYGAMALHAIVDLIALALSWVVKTRP
ncbi:MAG TPA: CPBP family intramembrane glutamic endopeptidase [Symbiobacteriaceae bacterium]|nr:CPBP family intramembrane glutamic endopeptidase [Symbiobacteriaceae bacterium]